MEFRRFEPALFEYLEELTDNNNRPWFEENRRRYEEQVLGPAMAFIRDFRPRLAKISKFFVASDRRAGGSLMRIYRDARFTKDKAPYKTNVGIQFRHEFGKDIHAPGFYIHIAPDDCLLAVGVWRPDAAALGQIRQAILDEPEAWRRARDNRKFREFYVLEGDSLKRPPRDIPPDHPFIEDLKRTDFVGIQELAERDVLAPKFLDRVAESFTASRPLMRFLCEALKTPF
ncbi:MAG: DUF2461 domain-containing protein [Pirellulales bacterium]